MALDGGKRSKPRPNSAARTVKNTKLSSTGGSIAKNNTNFRKGAIGSSGGIPQKSNGEVLTNPQFDKLANTGRPKGAAMKTKKKLPSGMTQPTSKKLSVGSNKYGQPGKQINIARGAADSTTRSNLKSYLVRKGKGEVR